MTFPSSSAALSGKGGERGGRMMVFRGIFLLSTVVGLLVNAVALIISLKHLKSMIVQKWSKTK